jgi:hypothetical protein
VGDAQNKQHKTKADFQFGIRLNIGERSEFKAEKQLKIWE